MSVENKVWGRNKSTEQVAPNTVLLAKFSTAGRLFNFSGWEYGLVWYCMCAVLVCSEVSAHHPALLLEACTVGSPLFLWHGVHLCTECLKCHRRDVTFCFRLLCNLHKDWNCVFKENHSSIIIIVSVFSPFEVLFSRWNLNYLMPFNRGTKMCCDL